jgi:hypothetical protein
MSPDVIEKKYLDLQNAKKNKSDTFFPFYLFSWILIISIFFNVNTINSWKLNGQIIFHVFHVLMGFFLKILRQMFFSTNKIEKNNKKFNSHSLKTFLVNLDRENVNV